MKILLRRWGSEFFVWKEATFNKAFFVENQSVKMSNIISIDNDTRNEYVICSNCGEMIRNTPNDIENHFVKAESECSCQKCNWLRIGNKTNNQLSYTKQSDGQYCVSETYTSKLWCSQYSMSNRHELDESKASGYCLYARCRKAGVKSITDVFTTYPHLFDIAITTDQLIDKKWSYDGVKPYGTPDAYFTYNGHLRDSLYAIVNEAGIVNYFVAKHNRRESYFVYSAIYDKIFTLECGEYYEGLPSNFSDNKSENIYKKIRALYKGVNVNE